MKVKVKIKQVSIAYGEWIVEVPDDEKFGEERNYETLEDYLEKNYLDGKFLNMYEGYDEIDVDDYEVLNA
jgi:hypothetical protein